MVSITRTLLEVIKDTSGLSVAGLKLAGVERIKNCAIRSLTTNEIIEGTWHGDCYDAALEQGWFPGDMPQSDDLPRYVEAGFTTNSGRFLGRKEALALAKSSRQYSGPKKHAPDYELEATEFTEAVSPYFLKRLNQLIRRGDAQPLREAGRSATCVTASALIHGEPAVFTFSLDHRDHIAVAVTAQRDGLSGKSLGTFVEIDDALKVAVATCKDLDRMWSKSVS